MLTLYDDVFSPYARKVRIALYEKGVPFERVRALHGDCNRTDFLHVNPRAEVPALVDGEFSLYDSTIICEYLEDRHPEPPIYPRDPRLRAECRLLEDLADKVGVEGRNVGQVGPQVGWKLPPQPDQMRE